MSTKISNKLAYTFYYFYFNGIPKKLLIDLCMKFMYESFSIRKSEVIEKKLSEFYETITTSNSENENVIIDKYNNDLKKYNLNLLLIKKIYDSNKYVEKYIIHSRTIFQITVSLIIIIYGVIYSIKNSNFTGLGFIYVLIIVLLLTIKIGNLFVKIPFLSPRLFWRFRNKSLFRSYNNFINDIVKREVILSKQTEEYWNTISGHDFEKEVSKAFKNIGYKSYLTSGSGDDGIDIVLYEKENVIGVQCKAWYKPLPPYVVREFIGALNDKGYNYGIIVSLNGLSKKAQELAERNNIKCYAKYDIMTFLRQVIPSDNL